MSLSITSLKLPASLPLEVDMPKDELQDLKDYAPAKTVARRELVDLALSLMNQCHHQIGLQLSNTSPQSDAFLPAEVGVPRPDGP